MENLDALSEEQLDELLREAVEINQRLKSFERKQTLRAHGGSNLHVETSLFTSHSTDKDNSSFSSQCNERSSDLRNRWIN